MRSSALDGRAFAFFDDLMVTVVVQMDDASACNIGQGEPQVCFDAALVSEQGSWVMRVPLDFAALAASFRRTIVVGAAAAGITAAAAPALAQTCGPGCTALTFSVDMIQGTDKLVAGGHVVSVSHDLFVSNLIDSTMTADIQTNTVGSGGLLLTAPPAWLQANLGLLPNASTADFFAGTSPDALLTTTGAIVENIPGESFPVTGVSDLPPAMAPDLLGVNPGVPVLHEAVSPAGLNAYEEIAMVNGDPVDALVVVDFYKLNIVQGFSAVPEPAAWAMMLIGLAGLGGALRRRGASAV